MTNMIVQGMHSPALFTLAFALNVLMLGMILVGMIWLREETQRTYIELRVLQVSVENQNAILVREGLKKPDDNLRGIK
jgi:hypothetical protein